MQEAKDAARKPRLGWKTLRGAPRAIACPVSQSVYILPTCVEILAKEHTFKLLAAECKINSKPGKRKRQDDTQEDAAEEEPADSGKPKPAKPAAKNKAKAKAKAKA